MATIKINGKEVNLNAGGLQKFSELVELIKATIDPEHMITALQINGRDIEDHEWQAPLSQFQTAIIEIDSGMPEAYVGERLIHSGDIVKACFLSFRDSRKMFQEGDMVNGNKELVQAVNTLKEFFTWYVTLIELLPKDKKTMVSLDSYMNDITESCKKICQQQLYQSWWALSESLANDLEPKLDKLEDHCRKLGKSFEQARHAA